MKDNAVICPPCGENVGLPTKKGAHQGFTLIELLVVVLIIGILAAVAVPQYQIAVKKAKARTILPILNAIVKADEAYYLANGEYAFQLEKLDIDMPGNCTPITGDGETTYVNPKYKCGNDFMIDFQRNDTKKRYFTMAFYCPGYNNDKDECKSKRDFSIWAYYRLDSKNPGKIYCGGQTTFGKNVCKTMFQ